jgi:hypothetical protein
VHLHSIAVELDFMKPLGALALSVASWGLMNPGIADFSAAKTGLRPPLTIQQLNAVERQRPEYIQVSQYLVRIWTTTISESELWSSAQLRTKLILSPKSGCSH